MYFGQGVVPYRPERTASLPESLGIGFVGGGGEVRDSLVSELDGSGMSARVGSGVAGVVGVHGRKRAAEDDGGKIKGPRISELPG